ncbi:MAG: glycosyl hydrolase family 18 protein [Clostridiales bacterium]|nr:glycosyl hydrolase family 18 protein [Clostridiales bacterium]
MTIGKALPLLFAVAATIIIALAAFLLISPQEDDSGLFKVYCNKKFSGLYWYMDKNTPWLPASVLDQFPENPGVTIDAANLRLNIDMGTQNIAMADEVVTDFVKTHAGTVYIPLQKIEDTIFVPLNTVYQFFRLSYSFSGNSIYLTSEYKASGKDAPPDFSAPKKTKWEQGSLRINLAWQYVNKATPEAPPKYDGLDIISPTWFHLITGGGGSVENNGDKGYADLCHERGYLVWATITNSMTVKGSTKFTTEVFSSPELLNKSVAQFLFYSCLYDADGINIDYEDVEDDDAAGLVDFTRALRGLAERQGLNLSIDTLIPKPWTIEYDRENLAKYVDYIAVMTYDEHWSTSPKPGSISSLPWAEQAVQDTLSEGVPASQILLGVPLYTRVWTINQRGKIASNKAAGMAFVRNLLESEGLEPEYLPYEQQNYVEYDDEGNTAKIWIEDAVSIKNRVGLAEKYGLAGTACWQFSQAADDIWPLFAQNNEQEPEQEPEQL